MRLYSVFLRRNGAAPGDLVLVRDGFSWPAFLFTAAWALWCRMWWPAAAIFAVVVLSGWAARALGIGEGAETLVGVFVALGIGMVGHDVRRWSLDRAGYDEVGVVTGKNVEDATRRFLDDVDVSADGVFVK